MAVKKTAQDVRNSELAQIHIAQAQLGMDDDTYRNVLWTVARVRSSKDLDWSGRKRVLDHMKACGFKVPGITINQGEDFVVTPFETELAEVA